MPGEVIELEGDARALVAAVIHLAGYDFALIGGLAVMVRLQEAHRVTGDLDGVFDNPTDVPTTAALIAAGIARDSPAPQRVIIVDTDVDVIDTFALPDATADLPDDPKDRLFVCAHRYLRDGDRCACSRRNGLGRGQGRGPACPDRDESPRASVRHNSEKSNQAE